MKKMALVVLVALIAASPAAAATKKSKKAAAAPAAPAKIDTNEASWRLVKGSLPIFLPAWTMPLYLQSQEQPAAAKKSKKK